MILLIVILVVVLGVVFLVYNNWRRWMVKKPNAMLPSFFKGFFNFDLWLWCGVLSKWKFKDCGRYRMLTYICAETGKEISKFCHEVAGSYHKEMWIWDYPDRCEEHTDKNYTDVLVCMDTGDLPNGEWCPSVGALAYRKDQIPQKVCSMHKAPEKKKISEDFQYPNLKINVSAFFLKGGLCLNPTTPGWSEKGFFDVIDYIAEHDLSNTVRLMILMNEHGANETEVITPHPIVGGLYYLHSFKPEWEDQVKRRLDYIAERGITSRLLINDGHAIRQWHCHWADGDNNSGWNGQQTYRDKYGWTHWTHVDRDPNYGNEDERARYIATKGYVFHMYDYIFNLAKAYKPFVIIDNNEMEAYAYWHLDMKEVCAKYGYNRDFMISSVMALDYWAKPHMAENWIPEIHSINSLLKYEGASQWIPKRPNSNERYDWLPAADGFGEAWIDMGAEQAAMLLSKSIDDGNRGFQGNSEGKWDDMNPQIYVVAKAMRDVIRTKYGI